MCFNCFCGAAVGKTFASVGSLGQLIKKPSTGQTGHPRTHSPCCGPLGVLLILIITTYCLKRMPLNNSKVCQTIHTHIQPTNHWTTYSQLVCYLVFSFVHFWRLIRHIIWTYLWPSLFFSIPIIYWSIYLYKISSSYMLGCLKLA